MNLQKRQPFLSAIRSIGFALIILAVSTWTIIGLFYEMLGEKIKYEHPDNWLSQYWDIIVLIFYILIIAVACFYIVRQNPKSIWFVPLICNAYSIAVAITEPASFWNELYGIIYCFGWALSIAASVIGAGMGKSKAIIDNHQPHYS